MSGSDERPTVVEDGKVLLPAYMINKVTVVHSRFSDTTKCDYPDCNEDDEYLVCIGPKARLSTLQVLCCEIHLRWATEKVYENWTNLKVGIKKYYERTAETT